MLFKKLLTASLLIFLLPLQVIYGNPEFDGVTETDVRAAMNMPINLVNDRDGNIFIHYWYPQGSFTRVYKAAKWNGDSLYIFSKADGFDFGVVRSMTPDNEAGMWMASAQGIAYYHDGQIEHYPLPQDDLAEGVRKIIQDFARQSPIVKNKEGEVWVLVKRYEKMDTYTKAKDRHPMDEKHYEIWKFYDGKWTLHTDDTGIDPFERRIRTGLTPEGNMVITTYSTETDPVRGVTVTRNMYTVTDDDIEHQLNPFKDYFYDGAFPEINPAEYDYSNVSNFTTYNDGFLFAYTISITTGAYNLYNGFSIADKNLEEWKHYGMPGYEDEFDYNPIPVIAKRKNWDKWPYRANHAVFVDEDPNEGVWMGMNSHYTTETHQQGGGGLIYYHDGNFERFSPHKDPFIEVLEFGPGREHYGSEDGIRFSKIVGVAYDRNKNLWVASAHDGLFSIPAHHLPGTLASVEEDAKITNEYNKILLYPSLVNEGEHVQLEISEAFKGKNNQIIVHDLLGREVIREESRNQNQLVWSLETTGLPPGMYAVSVVVNGHLIVPSPGKFIVTH